jgi:hypothetical protein
VSERAFVSDHFGGAGALKLFMLNLHMETIGVAPLLFFETQTSKN